MPRLEFAPFLPSGWLYTKLTDVSELISRGRSPQYVDHSLVRAIGQRCVRDSFDGSAARGQNPNRLEGHLKAIPGDVLLNSTGTGTIGRSCVFNDAGDFVVDSHVTVIRPQLKKLHPQWVNMMLRSPRGQTNLETFCYAGSTNQVELARTPLAETEIPLPPLPEQRRIASILDTLDRTIEATQRIISKLQAARQGLLHDLLTRGLDEQGQLRDPQRYPEQFKDTALGRVPVEWEVCRLHDVATKITDGDHHTPRRAAQGVLLLSARNVLDGELALDDVDYVPEAEYQRMIRRCFPEPGDILISCSGTIGRVSEVPADLRCCLVRSAALVKLDRRQLTSRFAEWVLRSAGTQLQIARTQLQAAQPNLFQGAIQELLVPLPSITEQEAIAVLLDGQRTRERAERLQLAKLQTLKRGLMEDLLTGQVRVAGGGRGFEDKDADAAVQPVTAELPSLGLPPMPPPLPAAPQHRAMYRAGAGASPEAMSEWTQQLWDAAQGQQVGPYSHAALDAVLPQLAAASSERTGVARIPELLAGAGVRFMLLPHPRGSKASGAAFYLDEGRTQPVVGLSLRYPLLDVFWFNLFHELGHIRLGHQSVLEEALDSDSPDPKSPNEQAADAFAREQLIPEVVWQPFFKGAQYDSNRIKRLARGLNRHPATVAGRLAFDTQDWRRFNAPELRPNIERELRALMAQLGTMREPLDP